MENINPHGNELFVTLESYSPKAGKTDDLLHLVEETAKHLEQVDGALMYQILAPRSRKLCRENNRHLEF